MRSEDEVKELATHAVALLVDHLTQDEAGDIDELLAQTEYEAVVLRATSLAQYLAVPLPAEITNYAAEYLASLHA